MHIENTGTCRHILCVIIRIHLHTHRHVLKHRHIHRHRHRHEHGHVHAHICIQTRTRNTYKASLNKLRVVHEYRRTNVYHTECCPYPSHCLYCTLYHSVDCFATYMLDGLSCFLVPVRSIRGVHRRPQPDHTRC